ncbi:MAG: phenylalanine--tRNA ligase subunit beta [Vicinamibacterales bacterium]
MRIVHAWLAELVGVPSDIETVASEIALRGFEVASVETTPHGVIDFEITANRPDCLSHAGLAREASVIWATPVTPPGDPVPEPTDGVSVEVDLLDAELCPRYCAQVFDVRIGPSPSWLAERLEAAGVRPINNIVDVTNYVMLEMGQPMHAFDHDRLSGGRLVIRRARAGETLRTLDGVNRALAPDMLVIADAARATAVAGVMGGGDSEIDANTRRMVLESAYFHSSSVRRTSKRLGLKTEASVRFERGGDVEAPPAGIARAAALFDRIGGGRPVGPVIDRYPSPKPRPEVSLRLARIGRLLGQPVPADDVPRILTPLEFGVTEHGDGWLVTVPTFRVDVTREADLIEEVGRHFGFDRIPAAFPALTAPPAPPDPAITRERLLRQVLTASGFSEAMTFAFMERDAALPFCLPDTEPAAIANPLSEKYAVLRPSLLPGVIDSCAHNRRRAGKDIRLFETGSRFTADGEGRATALAWCGAADGPHWSAPVRNVDFFDLKGVVERVCATFGVQAEFVAADRPYLVRGRSAEVRADGAADGMLIGVLGQLTPAIAESRGFPGAEEMFVAEIDVSALFAAAAGDDVRAESLPRYPSVVRDVSLLIPEALPASAVRGTIRSAAPSTLVSIVEFDRYTGKGVPQAQVSLSLRLTFRAPDRTLTDDEVQVAMEVIVASLRAAHGAEQR